MFERIWMALIALSVLLLAIGMLQRRVEIHDLKDRVTWLEHNR